MASKDGSGGVDFKGKGQARRLGRQHELGGGPKGIFGKAAQLHDLSIRDVAQKVFEQLKLEHPYLTFRHRESLPKQEINQSLQSFDPALGETLFLVTASIKPDGGILEVLDNNGRWRVVLVSESKHQGNDVEKISAGVMQGKNKDQHFMVAGNAIERVHKNINEMRNFMLMEAHFPYVVFLQGSNFATQSFDIQTPSGNAVRLQHDAGALNRIDRVTAANYSMEINKSYVRNLEVGEGPTRTRLQAASLFFQCQPWSAADMYNVMYEIAEESLEILEPELVPLDDNQEGQNG